MRTKKIPIIEIFGPVIQGEGLWAGYQTVFVRTGGCDYRCKWCDTMYAVDPQQVKENSTMMSQGQIFEGIEKLLKAKKRDCRLITLSGGNPCIHNLEDLIDKLRENEYDVTVETQGTLYPDWLSKCHVTLSPKPPSSGNVTPIATLKSAIFAATFARVLKIVVFDEADYEYAQMVISTVGKYFANIYLQPGSPVTAANDVALKLQILNRTKWLWEKVLNDPNPGFSQVRVIPQLHTLVYGQIRGV